MYVSSLEGYLKCCMTINRVVPFSSKFAFGVGQFAEGLKNGGFGFFILFYYNQVLGLSGTLAGAALFIALIFDAVTDPLAGSLSDNLKSKFGRRHPFMYASAIPLALAFFGLFAPPEGLSEMMLFAWLTVFAILTRGAMTLYHVPHLALGAEMTEDFQERTTIVAFRQFFGTLGGAAAILIGLNFFFSEDKGGRLAIENYMPYAITLGIAMVVTIWYSAYGTQKEIPHLLPPTAKPPSTVLKRLISEFKEAFQNSSFRWLFFGVLIVFIMAGVNSALDLYMLQYFWGLTGDELPAGCVLRWIDHRCLLYTDAAPADLKAIWRRTWHVGLGDFPIAACCTQAGRCLPRKHHNRTGDNLNRHEVRAGYSSATGLHLVWLNDGRCCR